MVTGRIVEGGYQVQLNGVINIIVNMIKIVIHQFLYRLPTERVFHNKLPIKYQQNSLPTERKLTKGLQNKY